MSRAWHRREVGSWWKAASRAVDIVRDGHLPGQAPDVSRAWHLS